MQSKIEKIDPDKKYRRVLAASTLAGDSVRNSVGEDLGKLDENDRHPVRQGNRDLGVRCYENDVEVLVQLRTRVRPGTFRTRPTPDRNGWAGAWRSPCDVRPCNPGGNRRRFPNRVLSLRDTAARSSSRSRRANTVLFVRPVLICGLPAPTVPASNRRLASDPTSPAGFFRFTESGGRIGTCAGLTRRADNRGPLVPRTPARGCCRLRQRSRLCPSGRPRSRSLGCRVSPRTHSR
jgi:hypothetical protein